MPLSIPIQNLLKQKLNARHINIKPAGGGCINESYKVTVNSSRAYFVKVNSASKFPHLFRKEKNGLQLIAAARVIEVPVITDVIETEEHQLLILEWIEQGKPSKLFWKKFGEQLAALHHITNVQFGLPENNFMGSVPQSNVPSKNWVSFFIQHRLTPLVEKSINRNLLPGSYSEKVLGLYHFLPQVFDEAIPSLVHGDLWSGNYLCNQHAEPVLIDPAAYFGHRSVDLGMTTLFGGFDKEFYEAYNYHYTFPYNYAEQWELCNLYPLLIHLLLFGKGYLPRLEAIVDKYAGHY